MRLLPLLRIIFSIFLLVVVLLAELTLIPASKSTAPNIMDGQLATMAYILMNQDKFPSVLILVFASRCFSMILQISLLHRSTAPLE
jgi:hypothetical protein